MPKVDHCQRAKRSLPQLCFSPPQRIQCGHAKYGDVASHQLASMFLENRQILEEYGIFKQLCLSPSYIGLVPTAPIVSSIYARVFRLQVWVRRVLLGVSGLWSGFASYNQDLGAISGKALGLRWFASHLGVAREVASVIRGLNINA
jgi:hypothetical protein